MDAEALLIPGLPEEVARECLVRVRRDAFPAARSVCKLWRRELDSPAFHRLRRLMGLARPLIALAQIERHHRGADNSSKAISYCLAFYDPHSGEWSSPPPINPGGRLPLFCQIAGAGRELVVVGGWDPSTWTATDGVHIYDAASGEWRRGARMPGPRRSFFACAASPDGRTVYVAGGHDEEKNALRSALAYDVARNEWVRLPDMSAERDECGGVVFRRGGAFHVIGGYATDAQGQFVGSSEAFDPATGRWWGSTEEHTMTTAGVSPRGIVAGPGGRLFRCAEGYVEVLEDVGEGSAWRKVAEIPNSGDGKLQAVAPCLVCWPGDAEKLTLVGSSRHGGSPPAGYTLELRAGGEVAWAKEAAPPKEYAGHVQAACCLEI